MTLFRTQKSTFFKAAVVGVFATSTAFAAHAGDVRLQYAPEDLGTAQGVAKTYAKIVRVAKESCPSYSQTRALSEMHDCIDTITNSMVDKIGNAQLSAYHNNGASVANRVQVAEQVPANSPNPS